MPEDDEPMTCEICDDGTPGQESTRDDREWGGDVCTAIVCEHHAREFQARFTCWGCGA